VRPARSPRRRSSTAKDDWAGYKVYADHPAHEQIKHDISSKIIDADNKSTIQLEL
jgi:hypothetical protein